MSNRSAMGYARAPPRFERGDEGDVGATLFLLRIHSISHTPSPLVIGKGRKSIPLVPQCQAATRSGYSRGSAAKWRHGAFHTSGSCRHRGAESSPCRSEGTRGQPRRRLRVRTNPDDPDAS